MPHPSPSLPSISGYLLVDKPKGKTSFSLVAALRRKLGVKKVGHAGTLDPFATGLMVMLLGRDYTRLSDKFMADDKEYRAEVFLGVATDTYDCEGKPQFSSSIIPSHQDIKAALDKFQGSIEQIPPMFSAKKINGQKLYHLARKGKVIERPPAKVRVSTELLDYEYPYLKLLVRCSKGTYIRSIAHELGEALGCGAHLSNLSRTKSGPFHLEHCIDGEQLFDPAACIKQTILNHIHSMRDSISFLPDKQVSS